MSECNSRGTDRARCRDRVVTVVDPPKIAGRPGQAEVRALRVLAAAGLVPPARVMRGRREGARDNSAQAPSLQANPGIVMQ